MKKILFALIASLTLMSCSSEKTSRPAVNVENGKMTPEVLLSLGRLGDPQMSPDGSKILYGVSYTSIEENKSVRQLFVCNADGTGARQITSFAKSANNARWNGDGSEIYFIKEGQIWKAPFKGSKLGKAEKISDIPAGVSEFKISPDFNNIIYISTIKNPDMEQPADVGLDKANAYSTEELMYRHWDHWVTEIPRSFVASLVNGTITPETSFDILGDEAWELPTEPFGGAEQLDWHPDSRHIAYSCRKIGRTGYAFSTDTEIYVYDIVTGATECIAMGGGYDTDPVWSPDGKHLAWISMERNGYEADRQRLMVADIAEETTESDGQNFGLSIGNIRELTTDFIYDVEGIFWSPCSGKIFFASTITGLKSLCSVKVHGDDSAIKRLTPSDWWYNFSTPFAFSKGEDGISLYTTYQCMKFPTEIVKVTVSGGEASFTQISHENDHIISQLSDIDIRRQVVKTAQGEDLYFWVLLPPGFDENGKYPGIEMFNGGPQSCLDQSWSYRWNFRLMAQQGYVVILPNRHGNSGFGQPWKEQISGDYQGLNMEDYKIAARWFKERKWGGKLAGVGASYGGFSVYNMMGIHGDLFDCFVSHAGIFDERQMWYTTEEMWFPNWDNGGLGEGETWGGIQQGGAPYSKLPKAQYHYANDPGSRVTKWHTPILCMHGMLDFRIPYEQGMAAFNAAKMMGVPAKLVIFPDECHWILQPQNALYWHRNFFDWTDKWTK